MMVANLSIWGPPSRCDWARLVSDLKKPELYVKYVEIQEGMRRYSQHVKRRVKASGLEILGVFS